MYCLHCLTQDPELAQFLENKSIKPAHYAMPGYILPLIVSASFIAVLGFNSNSPPFSELLQLWDVSIAQGIHFHVRNRSHHARISYLLVDFCGGANACHAGRSSFIR